MVKKLKIVAADSSAAILNENFEPLSIVATAAVLVSSPYREPSEAIAEPVFAEDKNGYKIIVREAELCKELLGKVKAEVVHIDLSFGAVPLEQLSPIQLSNMKISSKAKGSLLKILPGIRRVACEIKQKYDVEVLAIGKESIPVRVAELTAGAYAMIYASEKVVKEKRPILLGLPSKCQPRIVGCKVYLNSLMEGEHDVRGYAEDTSKILENVNIFEMLNPCVRGFRALKIVHK